jgi:glyoxylase-like metal-dependent hydrolase (beta-lactamase superfamily II)
MLGKRISRVSLPNVRGEDVMAEVRRINESSQQRSRQRLGSNRGILTEVTPGVTYMTALMANLHTIDVPENAGWVLVDTGVAGSGMVIKAAVHARYGADSKPLCIVATHGHFDHAGSVEPLAREWNVPVYAHRLEMPYLTGKSSYPPPDPTVGGAMAQLSRFFRKKPYHISDRLLQVIPDSMSLDELPGWRIIHTPGHTHGHISLFRESDRVLIAGDAVSTLDQKSLLNVITQARRFAPPPQYYTSDWDRAEQSMRELAALHPEHILCGHGKPVSYAADEFAEFVRSFERPRHGRYVHKPAIADERGVIELPPAPPDPVPRYAAAGAVAAGTALLLLKSRRKRAA